MLWCYIFPLDIHTFSVRCHSREVCDGGIFCCVCSPHKHTVSLDIFSHTGHSTVSILYGAQTVFLFYIGIFSRSRNRGGFPMLNIPAHCLASSIPKKRRKKSGDVTPETSQCSIIGHFLVYCGGLLLMNRTWKHSRVKAASSVKAQQLSRDDWYIRTYVC